MKIKLSKVIALSGFLVITVISSAQTTGTLSFSFSQLPHTAYSASKNVMAIWIQSSTGQFVLTRIRNAASGTKDHLPTWAVNSGGTASNCMAASCNVVSATTGATFTSFTNRSITWDGTDATGSLVPDGTYKVTIQSTWNHGSTGTATRSFSFVKGPSSDIQTPTDDANFTTISLNWNPTGTAGQIENVTSEFNIYPNPSHDGYFNIDYSALESIQVFDVTGTKVKDVLIDNESGTQTIDLSTFNNGIYIVRVKIGEITSERKIVLNK